MGILTTAQMDNLLDQVRAAGDVGLRREELPGGRWRLTIAAPDQVGVLTVIAGLLAAYRFDIVSADIQTVRLPAGRPEHPRPPRGRRPRRPPATGLSRKALDVFVVRPLGDSTPGVWAAFESELKELLGALGSAGTEEVLDRIIDRFVWSGHPESDVRRQLYPMSIDIANDPEDSHTRLVIESADVPGFLFTFAHALAGIAVNIEGAEVRSVAGEARDTFWVTDLSGRRIDTPQRMEELRAVAALLKQFAYLLPRSPHPGQAVRQFTALVRQIVSHPEWRENLGDLESPEVLETIAGLLGVSRFLWEDFLRLQHENLFPVLVDRPGLEVEHSGPRMRDDLDREVHAAAPEDRVPALNRFKDREMFRIDLRHITGRTTFQAFSTELTALAEAVIASASRVAQEGLRDRFGMPLLERSSGETCPWCVLGLGKFGGSELGFGSDLELLFVYGGEGGTSGPERVTASEYFEEFVRSVRGSLHARQEGIFEIDMRLRPFGRAGKLAVDIAGMRAYYAAAGSAQQFERLALVKLRPVSGDRRLGEAALEVRNAFVYSGEPLDRDNVVHLRRRQGAELVVPGEVNAKYSPGGLVDVEYAVQTRQIIAGRADHSVRVTNTLEALDRLAEAGHLPMGEASELRHTYILLRRLIDALRVVRGHAKDLTIPPAGSREFGYLAHRLRYSSPGELDAEVRERMGFARGLWL